MVATARPGQLVLFETRDALDSDLNVNSQGKDLAAVDLNLVHPLTGPVFIEGAKRGDVLAVTLVDVDPGRVRLHHHRAGLRLPARPLHRALHRQLAAQPDGGRLRPGAGRGDSDERLHGHGRNAARARGSGHLGGARDAARRGRRCRVAAAAHRCAPGRHLRAERQATRTSACVPFRRARTAATWTSSRWWSAPRCCCRATSTAAACSWATFTMRRATAKCAEPPSRWARRSRCAPRSAAACCR